MARYAAPLHCAIDGTVVFYWSSQWHDLHRFASQAHMEACDFTGAQELAPVQSDADAAATTSYYLACSTPGEAIHVGCRVSDHCARGQKLSVHVSGSVRAVDPADGHTPLLHVKSYAAWLKPGLVSPRRSPHPPAWRLQGLSSSS